jgi:hypothetical protein
MAISAATVKASSTASMTDSAAAAKHRQHDRQRRRREAHCLGLAVTLQGAGEQRHEGGVERPLGEQPTEEVGQLEGDEEGVGHGAGADQGGDRHVAQEAEHPARHRPAADGEERADQRHGGSL